MASRTPMEDRELAYLEELVKTSVLTHAQTERLATLKRKGEETLQADNFYTLSQHIGRHALRIPLPEVRWSTPTLGDHQNTLIDMLNANRRQYEGRWMEELRDPIAAASQARMEEAIASVIRGHEPTLTAFDEASGDTSVWSVFWGDAQIADLLPKRTLKQRITGSIGDRVTDARNWLCSRLYALGDWVDPYS